MNRSWQTVTDAGFAALVDPNSMADSLAYDSGTGRWTVTWTGSTTTLAAGISAGCPYRIAPLSGFVPADFDWDLYAIELGVRCDAAGMNRVSPYLTGLSIQIVRTSLAASFGPFVQSNTTESRAGEAIISTLGAAQVNVPIALASALIRKSPLEVTAGGFKGHMHYIWNNDSSGGFASNVNSSGALVTNQVLDDLSLAVVAPCSTGTALAAHAQTARLLIRAIPIAPLDASGAIVVDF